MRNHIATIYRFQAMLEDLNMAQGWVDSAKTVCASDDDLMAQLARQERRIQVKRYRIAQAMARIAMSN